MKANGETADSTDKQKIVVVEDENTTRSVTKLILTKAGYDVIEANNGLDGLAASMIHTPDLVICDVVMPKMSGFELLSLFRENPDLANIPFIFITGKKMEKTDIRKGMSLGADDYLLKPFTNKELLSAVQARLSKKSSLQKYYESQFDEIKLNIIHALPYEFRASLKVILGFSQLLIDMRGLSEEEVKEFASRIYTSGWQLNHLLENMALFDQLQLWMHDQNKIKELCRNSAASLEEFLPSIAEQQALKHDRVDTLRISMKDSQAQISPAYLTKIVEEVIDNALKFSKPGTIVSLSSEEYGSDVHIIIQDKGRGMSKEQIQKISAFQQFGRDFFKQHGVGFGLVIAKTLVELHNGNLTIESEEEFGTTVRISLPKAKDN